MARKVPSYRHYKPKNLGLVVINGKQHYLGKYGTPESLAEYHRLIQESLTPSPIPRQDQARKAEILVEDLLVAFWDHAEKHYRSPDGKPTGELDNFRDALRPLRRLYGHTLANSVGPLALRTVREQMVKAGLCRTTINARINRIRRVFRHGVSIELVPVEIYQALRAVPGLQRGRTDTREAEGIKPVPIEDVEATLPYLPAPVAAMVRLQLLTACRMGEVIAMRGCDLFPSSPNWEYRPSSHKTAWRGHHRVIPLGSKAQEIVKDFIKTDPTAYLFSPPAEEAKPKSRRGNKKDSGGLLLRATSGRPYLRRSYRQAVIRACDRAFPHPAVLEFHAQIKAASNGNRRTIQKELKKWKAEHRDELRRWRDAHRWSPLQLRHTAGTFIRSKYGLEAAQNVLGHSKADVTQIYAERDLAKAHSVMTEIG